MGRRGQLLAGCALGGWSVTCCSSKDVGMTRCDLEERDGGAFGLAAALLPVAQGVHADLEGAGELFLAELSEPSQRHDVFAGLDSAFHDATARRAADGALEIRFCPLWNVWNVSHRS